MLLKGQTPKRGEHVRLERERPALLVISKAEGGPKVGRRSISCAGGSEEALKQSPISPGI